MNKEWDLGGQRVEAHRREKEKKTKQFVMERNEKADGLSKEVAEVDRRKWHRLQRNMFGNYGKRCMWQSSLQLTFIRRLRSGKTEMRSRRNRQWCEMQVHEMWEAKHSSNSPSK